MRKKEFLEELESYLVGISNADREEILQDYSEHFKVGKKKKRSEAEIIKSLGDPKQIAREVRSELSSSKKSELKSEAIETWVATKKFSKHLFNEAKGKIAEVVKSGKGKKRDDKIAMWILIALLLGATLILLNSVFFRVIVFLIIVYFIIRYITNQKSSNHSRVNSISSKKNKTNMKKNQEISSLKLILSLAFNLLFFIWFWLSVVLVIIGLFLLSLAIIISGVLVLSFAIFSLISNNNSVINDLLLSGLFAGLGLTILGGLLLSLFEWLMKCFLKVTNVYLELNNNFIRQ